MPTTPQKAAPVAKMVRSLPPPPPKPITRRYSKLKPFGLKMFMKYKPTDVFNDEGKDFTGLEIQIWTQDIESRLDPDDCVPVGACIIKVKRWPVEDGESYETSIEELHGFSSGLVNQQVYIALVKMLWHSGPLALGCQDHLVINFEKLKGSDAWNLLRTIGFKRCPCPEFNLYGGSCDVWCFGNRYGTVDTDRGGGEFEGDEEVEESGKK